MKSESHPNVRYTPAPIFPSSVETRHEWLTWCTAITGYISATQTRQTFGQSGVLGVEETLPQGFSGGEFAPLREREKSSNCYEADRRKSPTSGCVVKIDHNGTADQISWYELWEEVVAIINICLGHGGIGTSSGLGESSRFFNLIGQLVTVLLTEIRKGRTATWRLACISMFDDPIITVLPCGLA